MEDCNDIAKYLLNNGLTNLERLKNSIDPNSVSIMHLGVEEWIAFTHSFAQKVNYFNNDETIPSGDWQAFFEWAKENKNKLEEYDEGEATPHITLFVAFLKLLNFSKESLNQLTKRHLDFYYREVLQLKNKPFKPDEVFTSLHLNKNISEFLVPKGTALNGQKCENGNIRNYKTEKDVVLNKAEITEFKNIYRDNKGVYVKSSEDVKLLNSIYPFGDTINENGDYGFSIASPELKLKDEERNITITIQFIENVSPQYTLVELQGCLKLWYTSEESWVNTSFSLESYTGQEIQIKVSLKPGDAALIAPTIDVHKREHQYPLIKFLFSGESGRKLFLNWSDLSLSNIMIETLATYSENLIVKTDQGIINSKNEFYPFGSLPKKGSKLSIHSDEWINKKILHANLELQWKGLPEDFRVYYEGYYKEYFDDNFRLGVYKNRNAKISSINGEDWFTVSIGKTDTGIPLFKNLKKDGKVDKSSNFIYEVNERYNPEKTKILPIILGLENDFFNIDYPAITTIAIKNDYLIPKPPFAPLVDKINVTITTNSSYSLTNKDVTLFHEYPFGYKKIDQFNEGFLPNLIEEQGECIFGIDNSKPNQLFNVLFQLEEGTENPEKSLNNAQTYSWQYLSENKWMDLSKNFIIENDIDQFLKSALVTFKIPTFNHNNTILPSGKLWIKASIRNHFETTSRIIGVHSQAILSRFNNNENALLHLKDGLEANTISKLINRQAQVKKIEQPYSSFNGRIEEDDQRFYRRISERLRHKDRCVSAFDYNHLILEKFPFIHKVKTINHSVKSKYAIPGEVLVLVVPSMINQKVFNVLKPMISQAKVNHIERFVNARNSMHVEAKVISPKYISVKIKAKVKYHEGYDSAFYNNKLKEDITSLFAPWAYDNTVDIPLGRGIYYSQIVHFIEMLKYVDYIKDLKMVIEGKEVNKFLPNAPEVVLTSVSQNEHEFEIIEKSICTT